MTSPASLPQRVLVSTADSLSGRSLATVLEQDGYVVLRVEGGRRALELARQANPDAVILEDTLADIGSAEVCRALRDDPLFDHATPIVVIAPGPVAHVVRSKAYHAGAWEYCSQPLDVETLLAKLRSFTRARTQLNHARAQQAIDPLTGLYTASGLQQCAEHLVALAGRRHEPFACVVVMPGVETESHRAAEPSIEVLNYLANVCREHSRRSDVIGYLGKWQFAILAPETNASGVMGFVSRLRGVLSESLPPDESGRFTSSLHAGYCAVADFAATDLEPAELLRRAEFALSHARGAGQRDGACSFDELPLG